LPISTVQTPTGVQIPDEGPAPVYCTLHHRDPGFLALARAELHALGGGYSAEPGVWLSSVPIRWAACGYGIAGGRQLAFATTLDALADRLRSLRLVAPRFSIATRRIPQRRKGATAAKTRIADCIDGDVSVENPQLRLLLVMSPLGYRVLVDAAAEPGEGDWVDASHKPHNYVVALPVRIAKAILNLTARPGDSVLDPFCGTGTIPLLAAWQATAPMAATSASRASHAPARTSRTSAAKQRSPAPMRAPSSRLRTVSSRTFRTACIRISPPRRCGPSCAISAGSRDASRSSRPSGSKTRCARRATKSPRPSPSSPNDSSASCT
jgi:hypothetical protein